MDEQEFAQQLYQGLGRPYLYLQRHSATPYRQALLRACLENPVFDRQCTGSRAGYLYELIQLTGEPQWYTERILERLAEPDSTTDVDQLLDFAVILAHHGSEEARRVMYERCFHYMEHYDRFGAYRLVELDGTEGFLLALDRMAELAGYDREAAEDGDLLECLEEQVGPEQVQEMLERGRSRRSVRWYLEAIEYTRARRAEYDREREALISQPYAQLKAELAQGGARRYRPVLRPWGERASPEDAQQAARDLLAISDVELLIGYLAIFERRLFPLGCGSLLPLAWHPDERVARSAILRLEPFRHAEVRALAFDLIAAGRLTSHAVNLLVRNYENGDERFLATLVESTADPEALHSLGFGINDVFEHNVTRAAAGLFLTLYEVGPCSPCRARYVQRLIEMGQVPSWMEAECLYDAEEDTRASIRAYRAARAAQPGEASQRCGGGG